MLVTDTPQQHPSLLLSAFSRFMSCLPHLALLPSQVCQVQVLWTRHTSHTHTCHTCLLSMLSHHTHTHTPTACLPCLLLTRASQTGSILVLPSPCPQSLTMHMRPCVWLQTKATAEINRLEGELLQAINVTSTEMLLGESQVYSMLLALQVRPTPCVCSSRWSGFLLGRRMVQQHGHSLQ